MIIDLLSNARLYTSLNARFKTAFDYLKETDLINLPLGRYELDGKNCFVNVEEYETKERDRGKWEAHREYIDIQCVVKGEEKIGVTNIRQLTPVCEYNSEKDICFFSGDGDFLVLREGNFMLLFPEDAHMPCIAVQRPSLVKKAVVKIRLD